MLERVRLFGSPPMAALAEGGLENERSDQIQPPLGDAGAIAVGADAADDEGVPVRLEMMLPADEAALTKALSDNQSTHQE